jgi:putative iron-regulated protein
MKKTIKTLLVLTSLTIIGMACSDNEGPINPTAAIDIKKKEFVENYASIVLASYEDTMTKVTIISNAQYFDNQIMGETIDNFNNPVMSAVLTLRQQGDALAQAGKTITGTTIDPSV